MNGSFCGKDSSLSNTKNKNIPNSDIVDEDARFQ
jgi:hypothetical protein